MWYNWVIPIVTLIVGLIGGFYGGVYYLKQQMGNMQMDEKQLHTMARSMGINLNQKQLRNLQRNMANVKPNVKKPAKPKK
ncbi:YneF family protein [Brevibacillus dissolubilis]|uniref:YneF family protein n=1 Tax=Brevibacillus dissolubilis TaxID=1844116 RepID=UPI00111771EC|nr:YneF family protein [Brevibacillus dissolubilis]